MSFRTFRDRIGFKQRSQFSIKALMIATAILAGYFVALPQFTEGIEAPVAHVVVSTFAGSLFVRSLGFRDPVAIGVGGGVGSALGTGIPAFVLFLFPQDEGFTLWGGYGVVLDTLAWCGVTAVALVAGATLGVLIGLVADFGERILG